MVPLSLRHAFAFSLLCASAALVAACDCSDDEDDPVEACDRIFEAVARVAEGCNLTVTRASVCGGVCADGGVGKCTERADIDACVKQVEAMSCGDVQFQAYRRLDACERVFRLMQSSCGAPGSGNESSGGVGDWDDWDD